MVLIFMKKELIEKTILFEVETQFRPFWLDARSIFWIFFQLGLKVILS